MTGWGHSVDPRVFHPFYGWQQDLNPALPIETVDQATLSMLECDKSPPFPDETVCFQGFGAYLHIPSYSQVVSRSSAQATVRL